MNEQAPDVAQILKELSVKDFLAFGVHDFAYIREVDMDEGAGYAVCSADGHTLSVVESREEAQMLIAHNDLKFITVQ